MESRGTDWANVLLPLALIAGLVFLLGFGGATGAEAPAIESPLESWLELGVGYLAFAAESAAAVVIGLAVARAFLDFARGIGGHGRSPEEIRLALGRMLALGLEFTIASDILRTAVAPTRADIVTLGAVVLLRTLLNHFLAADIREHEERSAG